MANDIFGGILDSMRGSVSDGHSFIDTALGDAIARGISGGSEQQNDVSKLFQANNLARMNNVPDNVRYSPASDSKFGQAKAEDFNSTERQWLLRIQRFASMDKSGLVNEGTPKAQ